MLGEDEYSSTLASGRHKNMDGLMAACFSQEVF